MPIPAVNFPEVLGPGAKPGAAFSAETDGPFFSAFMATAKARAADPDVATQAGSGTPQTVDAATIAPAAGAGTQTIPASPTAFLQASLMSALMKSPAGGTGAAGTTPVVMPVAAPLGPPPGPSTSGVPAEPSAAAQGQVPAAIVPPGPTAVRAGIPQLAAGQFGPRADPSATNASRPFGNPPPVTTASAKPAVPAAAATPAAPSVGPGVSPPGVVPSDAEFPLSRPPDGITEGRPSSPVAALAMPRPVAASQPAPVQITIVSHTPATSAPTPPSLSGNLALAAMVATPGTPAPANARPAARANPVSSGLPVGGDIRSQGTAISAAADVMATPPAGDGPPGGLTVAQQATGGKAPGLATALQATSGQFTPGSPAAATAAGSEPSAFAEIIDRLASSQTPSDARNDTTLTATHQTTSTDIDSLETAPRTSHGTLAQRAPVEQVVVQLRTAVKHGIDRISIQLKPASLGAIDVKLDVATDGRVTAVVSVERHETLDILQRDARALERALQDAGLRTDSNSLSFNLRGEGGHARSDTPVRPEPEVAEGEAGVDAGDIRAEQRPALASDRALDIEV